MLLILIHELSTSIKKKSWSVTTINISEDYNKEKTFKE